VRGWQDDNQAGREPTNKHDHPPVNRERRRFLKTGVAGSLLLGVASTGALLGGCAGSSDSTCKHCLWLVPGDRVLLTEVIPVMLMGALPESEKERKAAIEKIVAGFDYTVAHFPPSVRKEIRQLLDLLAWPLTRVILTGVMSAWENAEASEIHAFLRRWESSRFSLLRSGYSALHDLICGAWYVSPESWTRIGYPGPPALARG
jgi:hypothetical protein